MKISCIYIIRSILKPERFYIGSACKITGIDHRSISQVAAGSKTRKTAGGFIWKYAQQEKGGNEL